MLDGEWRFCGQHCGRCGTAFATGNSCSCRCRRCCCCCRRRCCCRRCWASADVVLLIKRRHVVLPCYVRRCPRRRCRRSRALLCCLLVDGRVEFAAITAHQQANRSKRTVQRNLPTSCLPPPPPLPSPSLPPALQRLQLRCSELEAG